MRGSGFLRSPRPAIGGGPTIYLVDSSASADGNDTMNSVVSTTAITLFVFLLLGILPLPARAESVPISLQPPVIHIIYPTQGQRIAAVDSTFILGSVTPKSRLTINGFDVPVYRTGGFLAFLPIDTGRFVFHLAAVNAAGSTTMDWPVEVRPRRPRISDSALVIVPESIAPAQRLVLIAGDFLEVSFWGTPGCIGHFRIDGVEATFPMTERESSGDSDSSRDGSGRTAAIPGFYTGVWQAPAGVRLDSARVWFCLSRDTVIADTLTAAGTGRAFCNYTECVRAVSPGLVSVNADEVPQVIELTDSVQIFRFGPRLGYLTTFQPAGVRAVYAGESGDWVRLRLAFGYSGWVEKQKTRFLAPGTPVPGGTISYIRTTSRGGWTDITLNLNSRLPYKIIEDPESSALRLLIFGATTNTDWVRYDPRDRLIERIDWDQTEPGVYALTVHLKRGSLWGYEVKYTDRGLVLAVRRPPDLHRGLRGLKVCVDPGHGPDPGAIGPTGSTEKDANLAIALALQRELEANGASVVMTRAQAVDVDLDARPAIARAEDVDLFISIHNNAVPDGINPYADNGTGAYYHHPLSHPLATALHRRLVEATGLPDYGLYGANFAVLRPTQYPSALVECAFMILPEHEELLRQREFQRRIAKGIARGLRDFVKSRAGKR